MPADPIQLTLISEQRFPADCSASLASHAAARQRNVPGGSRRWRVRTLPSVARQV
jgi:hypothetical protein